MNKQLQSTKNEDLWDRIAPSKSKKILVPILNSIQNGIMIVDSDGWVIYVNPAFQRITGLKSAQRLGKNILEIAPNCTVSRTLKTGHSIQNESIQLFDIPNELVANTDPIIVNGKIVAVISIFQDASEIKRLTKKIQGSQKTIKILNDKLSKCATAKYGFGDIVGASPSLMKSVYMADHVAQTESTVLILGESGTGKELFAHAIHNASKRYDKPFVRVNCAAIPDNLLESEFFGYQKGAFTGANQQKMGMFELANGGTIFLDEIGDMSITLQAKLLRVLEEGEMFRVGGTKAVNVDVRVIAATNRKLRNQVKEGAFREDLFYRISVLNVEVPSLRERNEDILLLAEAFLKKANRRLGREITNFSKEACEILMTYHWPGNVRELRNTIDRVATMASGNIVTEEDLHFILPKDKESVDYSNLVPLKTIEQEMIRRAIDKYGVTVEGKKKAASTLGISCRTLYNKLKEYKL